MRRFLLSLALLFASAQLAGVTPARAQSQDERAIRALLDRAFQANNSVDEKVVKQALGEFSASGGPFFPPFGASASSAADLEKLAVQFVSQMSARTFQTTSPVTVKVDKNLGWATYTWKGEATFKDGTRRSIEGRATVAFVREGKNWKIAHAHSSLPAALPATASALTAESQAVIQAERNAWEAIKNKQTAYFNDYLADDASSFDESQAYRVRGKAEILSQLDAWLKSSELRAYQMSDPQAQVLGDTALLTYYFTETGVSGGKDYSTAGKASLVLVKQGGKWKGLHLHRSVNK